MSYNKQIVQYFRNSVFNQMGSMPVSTRLVHFAAGLYVMLDYNKQNNSTSKFLNKDFKVQDYIPEFQRGDDKWDLGMKKKFVENLLKGVTSNIILCRIGEEHEDAFILDGQQRLTALVGFFNNEFSINVGGNKEEYYKDIVEEVKMVACNLTYYTISAKDMEEACQFYIDMNENITHSKEDIEIAYKYLKDIRKR